MKTQKLTGLYCQTRSEHIWVSMWHMGLENKNKKKMHTFMLWQWLNEITSKIVKKSADSEDVTQIDEDDEIKADIWVLLWL